MAPYLDAGFAIARFLGYVFSRSDRTGSFDLSPGARWQKWGSNDIR